MARIQEIVSERSISIIVLGLPLLRDGQEGPAAKKVRRFGEALRRRLKGIALLYVDESFTTLAASEKMRSAGKRSHQQNEHIDQAAAVEILEDYLQQP